MIETATVVDVRDDVVTVSCGADACKSCTTSFCGAKGRSFPAINETGAVLAKDDEVTVYAPPGRTVFAAFVVLILPLVLFVGGYFAIGAIAPSAGDGARILGGIVGLVAGFGVATIFGRARRAQNLPRVTQVIRSSGDVDQA